MHINAVGWCGCPSAALRRGRIDQTRQTWPKVSLTAAAAAAAVCTKQSAQRIDDRTDGRAVHVKEPSANSETTVRTDSDY